MVGTTCSVGENQPPGASNLLESYRNGSRCVRHGRQWTVNGANVKFGGGCYQVSPSWGYSGSVMLAASFSPTHAVLLQGRLCHHHHSLTELPLQLLTGQPRGDLCTRVCMCVSFCWLACRWWLIKLLEEGAIKGLFCAQSAPGFAT